MQPRSDRLNVYYGNDLVGTVHDSAPLSFEYAPGWLAGSQRFALAAIPLQAGSQATPEVQAFFENLLPEGELRDYLVVQRKASTLFSLLLEVAGDTAGAFVLLKPGQMPEPPRYEATTWEAIANLLTKRSASAIDINDQGARISLAGAQDKTSIALFDDGVPRLPKGTSPSTHILKPDIRRLAKVWHSAANEAIVMRAAALAGLPTAEVFYEPHSQACIVRRFDRQLRPDGTLARLVQYDLCQLAGTQSDRKYEKEGGPGLAACAALIRRYSAQPAVDLRHLVRWVFFNLYVGNNDGHAKNLSIYSVPGQGVTLTPFYDLMCTRMYPGLSPEFAFAIGGEVRPGEMAAENLARMAEELSMQRRFLAQQAREMADRLAPAMAQAVNEIATALSPSARTLAERLERFISSSTKKLASRFTAAR
ncbi:MAG: type II toxin-antitoxin system HipA family toxin [Ottowia sp.]|uniref:type II toxin-antitoxin system HipA family toxin n=1 Tax=Ottowia sp. TaxID=1898956 RepID=UPI0039E508D6